ncbi:MAG TPA: glycosyltransferase family 2 protein [Polyangiaceae bacterium]|nr:glycosyltransferase family 2 protein [Polyangiaceae bacterium]
MTVLGRVRALRARATPPRVRLGSVREALVKVQRFARRERFPALPTEKTARARITRGPIVIATSEQPRVSIVVPVHDRLAATLACLESLARTPVKTPFELIVVDDASDASIARLLEVFRGARSVRNAVSLGPLHACNVGARSARGEFLCFLDSDTRVTPGWLDALVETFSVWPRAGVVGARLLFPDGRLREAGGTVFRDGTRGEYGRYRDPEEPRFCFVRPVDTCSRACLVIPTGLFHDLGGFDERYAPGYCEDADLAFRARSAGYDVLYQPLARVVHYERSRASRERRRELRRTRTENQARLLERFRAELALHPAPGDRSVQAAERWLAPGVLALVPRTQDPLSPALRHLLVAARRALLRASVWRSSWDRATRRALELEGIECLTAPFVRSAHAALDAARDGRHRHVVFCGPHALDDARALCPRAPDLHAWVVLDGPPARLGSDDRRSLAQADGVLVADSSLLGPSKSALSDARVELLPESPDEAERLFG